MARKEFPDHVVESVLIRSRRHCCICDQWCGQKIQVHHIGDPSDPSEENAIPLCLNCHAEVKAYDPKHPIGRRYTTEELKDLKKRTFCKYDTPEHQTTPLGTTEYGRGFHEGADWARKLSAQQDAWRLLSVHGDFALEVLYLFGHSDSHPITDELLLAEDVETGVYINQSEGHLSAWHAGEVVGFWGSSPDTEDLFLTQKGIEFRNLVRATAELARRLGQLEAFWKSYLTSKQRKKPPSERAAAREENYPPGPMNELSMFVNYIASTSHDPQALYVIRRVSPASATVSSIADGSEIVFSASEIKDVRLDQKTGNIWIQVNPGGSN